MKKLQCALTGADKLVIRVLLCIIILSAAVAMCSCTKDEPDTPDPSTIQIGINGGPIEEHVTISFCFGYDITPMDGSQARTRAALSSTIATYLDLWIFDGETEVTAVHQAASDDGFGTVTATLEKAKTYTLYALAHKGDGAATLTDGILSFPDDKLRDTFWYTTTFTPSATTTVSCELQRIVAMFRLAITDDIPADVRKLRLTVTDVFDRWSLSGVGAHQLDRVSTISYGGTSKNFSIYVIASGAETKHTVTAEALDADDAVIQTKTFADVPLRNNYKTQYSGAFFTESAMALSFTAADEWQSYDTVTF